MLSLEVLQQMVEQNDEKHDDAHERLRESIGDVNLRVDMLNRAQTADHEEIIMNRSIIERRKEMSAYHIVIISSCIGGSFQLAAVALEHFFKLVGGN